jgi:hypothetical protein
MISLKSINRFGFAVEMQCASYEVGTEFLNIILMNFRPKSVNLI